MVFSVSTILSYTTANRVVERPEIPDSFRTQFPLAPEHPGTSLNIRHKNVVSRKLFDVKNIFGIRMNARSISQLNEITYEIIPKKISQSARRTRATLFYPFDPTAVRFLNPRRFLSSKSNQYLTE